MSRPDFRLTLFISVFPGLYRFGCRRIQARRALEFGHFFYTDLSAETGILRDLQLDRRFAMKSGDPSTKRESMILSGVPLGTP